jgi:protein CpxP
MTRQRILGAALVLLLLLNCATLALVARRSVHSGGIAPEDRPMHLVIQRLGLKDDQVAAYKGLVTDHRATIGDFEHEMRAVRGQMFQAIGTTDTVRWDSLATRISALQVEIERTHVQHFTAVRALCRPEQLEHFNALMDELSEHFGRRPHHGSRP